MAFRRDLEPVVLWEPGVLLIASGFCKGCLILLIVHIGDSLEEEKREDIGLEVGRVDRSTQDVCGFPEV
jgi:hypothetical protein